MNKPLKICEACKWHDSGRCLSLSNMRLASTPLTGVSRLDGFRCVHLIVPAFLLGGLVADCIDCAEQKVDGMNNVKHEY